MRWEFFADPITIADPSIRWRPTGVDIYKRLVDDSGTELTSIRVTLPDAMAETTGTQFAEDYLSVVRSHFDSQYDLIYSEESNLHPSMARTFGHELAMCLSAYIALKTGVSDEA